MEGSINRRERITNIIDGAIILAVVFFLCSKFRGFEFL